METNTENLKPKRIMTRKEKKLLFYVLVMAYPIIQFCIFYIGVNLNSILLAFKEYTEVDGRFVFKFVWFEQFAYCINMIKTEAVFRYAFKNSFLTYIISTAISSTLALFFSFYIYKNKFASSFFRIMLFIPSIISPLVLAILFNNLAEDALPMYLSQIFGKQFYPLISGKSAFAVLNFYRIWVGFGTSILIYNGSMSAIDVSVTEAAKLDGATGIKEFVFKPCVASIIMGIVTVAVYKICSSFISGGRMGSILITLIGMAVAIVVYFAAVFVLRIVKKEDVKMLPKGEKLAEIMEKHRLIKE